MDQFLDHTLQSNKVSATILAHFRFGEGRVYLKVCDAVLKAPEGVRT